jgi:hypothetical protein
VLLKSHSIRPECDGKSIITPARLAQTLNAMEQLAKAGVRGRNMTPQDVSEMQMGLYEKKRLPLRALEKNPTARSSDEFERTDLGNAEYFVELYGHIFRFDRLHKRWLEWRNHSGNPTARGRQKPRSMQHDRG